MVERINFGLEGFDDDEQDQADKIESKDSKDSKKDKPPKVSLSNLFERKKIEEDKDSDKLENLFVVKKNETEEQRDVEKTKDIESIADDKGIEETAGSEQLDGQAEIDDTEAVEVTRQMAEQRLDDLQEEQENADDPAEESSILAAANLAENLIEKLEDAEEVNDEILDEAVAETVAELGLEDTEEQVPELSEGEAEEQQDDDNTADSTTNAVPGNTSAATGTTPPTSSPPPTPPPPPPTPPPTGPPTPPPPPPTPPSQPMAMPPFGNNPNTVPTTPNTAPQNAVETVERRHSHVPYVLLGGVVGYLLGRRKGRIKTEKQLLPVQEKLEQEVTDLGFKLKEREDKIRALARKQHEAKPLDKPRIIDNLNQKAERRHEKQAQQVPVEKFIHPELVEKPNVETIKAPEVSVKPENMTLSELLVVANKMEYGGVSVKKLFESGRLDIGSLRRVTKEYLLGNNYQRELLNSLKIEQQTGSPEAINPVSQESLEYDNESRTLSIGSSNNIEQLASDRYGLGDSTPQIGNYSSGSSKSNVSSSKGKVALVVGSTAAVAVLAVLVALLLLAII